ncbi:MAG: GTPase ObgE [Limnohabitans sp.]|jgi:GTP-binding protein|nr:GTPase ObgE [Limnohabitans sp.]
MLVDEAIIHVRSGKGGNGVAHFRREKSIMKGGPDGGDGGRGGHVILVGDAHLDTLVEFQHRPHHFAKNGENGAKKKCHGSDAPDLLVRVPLGSIVHDLETDEFIADIVEDGQQVVVAQGGRGGWGNDRFKTATHQSPTECTPGGEPVERSLRIELKLIADVGFVGLPNAGKSTLLGATSRANAKVGDYPFTTRRPQLGIAELPGDRRLVLADIPGLIEGASDGAGLGHDFLRHIERTKAIVHLVDLAPLDGSKPAENYRTIRSELHAFSPALAEKPELVVFSKIDLVPEEERAKRIRRLATEIGLGKDETPVVISAATGEGLRDMLERAYAVVKGEVMPTEWRR